MCPLPSWLSQCIFHASSLPSRPRDTASASGTRCHERDCPSGAAAPTPCEVVRHSPACRLGAAVSRPTSWITSAVKDPPSFYWSCSSLLLCPLSLSSLFSDSALSQLSPIVSSRVSLVSFLFSRGPRLFRLFCRVEKREELGMIHMEESRNLHESCCSLNSRVEWLRTHGESRAPSRGDRIRRGGAGAGRPGRG